MISGITFSLNCFVQFTHSPLTYPSQNINEFYRNSNPNQTFAVFIREQYIQIVNNQQSDLFEIRKKGTSIFVLGTTN